MTLAPFVQTLGRGPGRSRSLTLDEAAAAMEVMLSGQADPEAVGALLMLLRMKGETAEEIAGFAGAAARATQLNAAVDLDWPSYAAGRTRGLPWFLLSARLVAQAGYRVLLHGWNGKDLAVRTGLTEAGIPVVTDIAGISPALDQTGIVYIRLEDLSPSVFDLLNLRNVLGLRSCINTVSRMLNPGSAAASVQGVFHPSYRLLQADAAQLLGWRALSVIKGGGGEFERNPAKSIVGFGLRGGEVWSANLTAQLADARRLSDGPAPETTLRGLLNGTQADAFAQAVVLGTAEIALDTLGIGDPADAAKTLWANRARALAA